MKNLSMTVCVALLAGSLATRATEVVNRAISETEVLAAQRQWCEAIVDISKIYETDGHAEAKAQAERLLDGMYGYGMGAVLFKPTLSSNPQTFRTTRCGALSYFVGGDPDYPSDSGFALKHWREAEAENVAVFIAGNSAVSLGKVRFTDKDGNITTVDKTWVFLKDDAGTLRIIAHHSSIEYTP